MCFGGLTRCYSVDFTHVHYGNGTCWNYDKFVLGRVGSERVLSKTSWYLNIVGNGTSWWWTGS